MKKTSILLALCLVICLLLTGCTGPKAKNLAELRSLSWEGKELTVTVGTNKSTGCEWKASFEDDSVIGYSINRKFNVVSSKDGQMVGYSEIGFEGKSAGTTAITLTTPCDWDGSGEGYTYIVTVTVNDDGTIASATDGNNTANQSENGVSEQGKESKATFKPIRHRICSGATSTAALLSDGTVSCSLDKSDDQYIDVNGEWLKWNDIVDISMNEELLAAVKKDGTVVWCGGRVKEYDWLNDDKTMGVIDSWKNMVQVSASPYDIAALRDDGSLEITGSIYTEDLPEKDGFTQVAVYDALLCLRENGTVFCYAPSKYVGQTWEYDVNSWSDIVQVSAGFDHAVGLKKDGTVVATGNNERGQCNTSDWSDIVQVYAGREHTIGLKSDGTVVYCGEPPFSCDANFLDGWKDIVEVSGFFDEITGLKSDGSIVYAGPADRHNPVEVSGINK